MLNVSFSAGFNALYRRVSSYMKTVSTCIVLSFYPFPLPSDGIGQMDSCSLHKSFHICRLGHRVLC